MNDQDNNARNLEGFVLGLDDPNIPVGWRTVFPDELGSNDRNGKRSNFMILRTEDEKYQRLPLFAFINDKQIGANELVAKIIRACASPDEIRTAKGNLLQIFQVIKGRLLGAYIDKGLKKTTGEPFNKITAVMKHNESVQMLAENHSGGGFSQAELDYLGDVAYVHDQNERKAGTNNGGVQ
jgi:hypothetical protein